jgi:MSHA biogenesis protein MshL
MTATGIFSSLANAHRLRSGVAAIAISAMLASCASVAGLNDYDERGGITKKDYEGLLGRRGAETVEGADAQAAGEPPIPDFQSVLATPAAPELADTRRVSIAVTETTPVRDIFIELTRKAGVDLELDPRVSGGVIMTATDRPFIEVIDRLVDLAELRYSFRANVLRVEVDDPYLEQYKLDVLNLRRTSSSSSTTSTDASSVAQALGGGGAGGNNKSASSIESTTLSDFWGVIGKNIDSILNGVRSRRAAAPAAIQATFIPQPQERAEPAPAPQGGGAGAGAAVPQIPGVTAPPAPGAAETDAPQLQASSTAPAAAASAAPSNYFINPEAGIIAVFANQRQQRAVARYIRDAHAAMTQQVLIEAKVVEVTLSDQYRAGVDWAAVLRPDSGNQNFNIGTNFSRGVVPPEFVGATIASKWTDAPDLSLAVQLVNQFGTVRILSSPRLTVLNNQMAQLKVAKNQVFFELDVSITDPTPTAAGRTTINSQIKTIPVGLIMSVQPAVDSATRRISLNLRPSITRITGFVNDPGIAVTVAVAQQTNPQAPLVSSPVPIIEVREMDSLITMESGQTVVMGGLMQEESETSREGLPGLMDVPIVGQAVSGNIKQNRVTELVVFIRATLADAPATIDDEDIRLYRKFTPDPRPIVF